MKNTVALWVIAGALTGLLLFALGCASVVWSDYQDRKRDEMERRRMDPYDPIHIPR